MNRIKPWAKKRWRLWSKDPCCFWCGQITIFDTSRHNGVLDDNVATVDHVESRLIPNSDRNKIVLACFRCNRERNREELCSIPPEEWRKICLERAKGNMVGISCTTS